MHDNKKAAPVRHRATQAAESPAARRAWTAPRTTRFATSSAESGGDTSTDGVEILS
jgi:hypothetical protein